MAGVTPEQVEIVQVRAGSCVVELLLHSPEQEACNARLAADMSNPHGLLRRNLGAISFVPPLPTQGRRRRRRQQQQQVKQLVQVCVPRAAMHWFRCMCRIHMLLTAAPATTAAAAAAAAAPCRVDRRPERTRQRPRCAKPRHTHIYVCKCVSGLKLLVYAT